VDNKRLKPKRIKPIKPLRMVIRLFKGVMALVPKLTSSRIRKIQEITEKLDSYGILLVEIQSLLGDPNAFSSR
jgi:hypothetical protein